MVMYMNNKGFAISGILYSILVLFLILLLLILGNFQSRKVTFDKQKDTVIEKLENREKNKVGEFCYDTENKEFITPSDGTYLLEIYSSDDKYISGKMKLYQGIKLFITVGKTSSDITSIRTEENKLNTVILSYYNDNDYAYSSGSNDDISLGHITEYSSPISKTQSICSNSGYVKISRIGD